MCGPYSVECACTVHVARGVWTVQLFYCSFVFFDGQVVVRERLDLLITFSLAEREGRYGMGMEKEICLMKRLLVLRGWGKEEM